MTPSFGGVGIVISVVPGDNTTTYTIRLDDCDDPFQQGETVRFSGGSSVSGISLIHLGTSTADCKDNPPVQRRNPPEDPAYNPQNYNKN